MSPFTHNSWNIIASIDSESKDEQNDIKNIEIRSVSDPNSWCLRFFRFYVFKILRPQNLSLQLPKSISWSETRFNQYISNSKTDNLLRIDCWFWIYKDQLDRSNIAYEKLTFSRFSEFSEFGVSAYFGCRIIWIW